MYLIDMWTLKIWIDAKKSIIGYIASENQVNVQLYPLSTINNNGNIIVTGTGIVHGDEDKIKQFLKQYSELPQVLKCEFYNNQFISTYQEKKGYEEFYNPEILFIKPWFIEGSAKKHTLTLGSWNKQPLQNLINNLKREHDGTIMKIVQEKNPDIFFFSVRPPLTKKQQNAFQLANKHGYYKYPRTVDLKTLSKIANISFSTFQTHLRKAETKLIPLIQ